MKAELVPYFRSCEEQQIPPPEHAVGSLHDNMQSQHLLYFSPENTDPFQHIEVSWNGCPLPVSACEITTRSWTEKGQPNPQSRILLLYQNAAK